MTRWPRTEGSRQSVQMSFKESCCEGSSRMVQWAGDRCGARFCFLLSIKMGENPAHLCADGNDPVEREESLTQ